ncbi:DUF4041 domain-containing protein [Shewanella sp. 1CM18E]|uniref:DUF4041 domain-containing protein n=1 Tax=Shewanella sp. 1CM18E TaxID=2929169 RepID=UPI0020BD7E52|nr:DUF4041 domain-containing protein [Shewanella sp. 1CM18E]MCK8044800.1 DUF4041 domain-containing protein [Shewanella sp. 1CM18E]
MQYEPILVVLLFGLLVSVFFGIKTYRKAKEYENKYSKIIDIDKEIETRLSTANEKEQEAISTESKILKQIEELKVSYSEKRKIYDQLKFEAAVYDEDIELAQLGFYKPHFDYDTSENFKDKLSEIKALQKQMITDKNAITCSTDWSVDGSKVKGRTMTNRNIRMTARAFNNECDAAISKVSWSNADRMELRIEKAFDAINKLNESNSIHINRIYLNLKLDELRLTHEYQEKKQREKEEQAEIRQQMREEAKLEKEFMQAQKEEDKYQSLLEKAKLEAEKATGSKLDKLNEKIEELNTQLLKAHLQSERAKSMAEQTKMGHVYVISNTGSFGENVYKIGMTRRLDPLDRVRELGDASVPFLFDVHAMIHSNDAPRLEKELHKLFDEQRLNLVNQRKEFFNVSLSEIEKAALSISPDAEFIETAEAREYRETLAIRAQREKKSLNNDECLPETI